MCLFDVCLIANNYVVFKTKHRVVQYTFYNSSFAFGMLTCLVNFNAKSRTDRSNECARMYADRVLFIPRLKCCLAEVAVKIVIDR